MIYIILENKIYSTQFQNEFKTLLTNKYINEVSNELFEIYMEFNRNGKTASADDIKIKLLVK